MSNLKAPDDTPIVERWADAYRLEKQVKRCFRNDQDAVKSAERVMQLIEELSRAEGTLALREEALRQTLGAMDADMKLIGDWNALVGRLKTKLAEKDVEIERLKGGVREVMNNDDQMLSDLSARFRSQSEQLAAAQQQIETLRKALEAAEIGLMCCSPLPGYDMETLRTVRVALADTAPQQKDSEL